MIQVVCALIIQEDRILAAQKSEQSGHPLKWEFPGGKIQNNELPEFAVLREIKEELALDVRVISALVPVEYNYGTKQITLIPFLCEIENGHPVLKEHVALDWFSFNGLLKLDLAEADRLLIEKNGSYLSVYTGESLENSR